jgi:hypothetical protein
MEFGTQLQMGGLGAAGTICTGAGDSTLEAVVCLELHIEGEMGCAASLQEPAASCRPHSGVQARGQWLWEPKLV